jgi:hypothetical protein
MKRILVLLLTFLILSGSYLLYLLLFGQRDEVEIKVEDKEVQDLGNEPIEISEQEEAELVVKDSEAKLAPEKFFFIIANVTPGKKITINSVSFENPGYVVVFTDKEGMPNKVFARSEILTGVYSDVSIDLPRNISEGEIFYAVLFADNGDSVFEVPGDDVPLVDKNNSPIIKRIVVRS